MNKQISIRFTAEGWHYWQGATGQRAYLANNHRHLFYVTVTIDVFHNDREIEFHDFLHECREQFPTGELGGQSCEMLAEGLIAYLKQKYPNRGICVEVWEDNEVGAILELDMEQDAV